MHLDTWYNLYKNVITFNGPIPEHNDRSSSEAVNIFFIVPKVEYKVIASVLLIFFTLVKVSMS